MCRRSDVWPTWASREPRRCYTSPAAPGGAVTARKSRASRPASSWRSRRRSARFAMSAPNRDNPWIRPSSAPSSRSSLPPIEQDLEHPFMRVTQRVLATLLLVATSCGGGQKNGTSSPGGGEGGAPDGAGGGAAAGGQQALPEIPNKPAPQPASVLATFSIGDPKGQLAELAAYVDAMQPGMG